LATALSNNSVAGTWAGFLESVVAILPERLRSATPGVFDPLHNVKFLPAQSGQLLSAVDETALFFQPRRGAEEGGDAVGDVPASIQNRVAFLHVSIPTQEGAQGRNTDVQKFLETRFAREFRRDDILRRVVEPAIPPLPVAHNTPAASLCADLLAWSLKLIGTQPLPTLVPMLRKLPVPCHGGWHPMGEATFGPGWAVRRGDAVQVLADALPPSEKEELLSSVLLSPDAPEWSGTMPRLADMLVAGGVVTGLRLQLARDLGWSSAFTMRGHGQHRLLGSPAPGFSQETWDAWRNSVRSDATPLYEGEFRYRLDNVYVLPVLIHVGKLPNPAARAMSDLLLASFEHWKPEWVKATLEKREGFGWTKDLKSPLRYALRTLAWLADVEHPRP